MTGRRRRTVGRPETGAAGGRRQARLFGRYLLGETPEEPFLERYVAASDTLFSDPPGPVVRFALRWPRALPFLDAASALVRPRGPLRSRLLVMAAVLEASPEHADRFLPDPAGAGRQLTETVVAGSLGGIKALVGLPILLLAERIG